MDLRTRKSVIAAAARASLRRLRLLPAFLVAAIDQLPELAIEAPERRGAADQRCGAANVLVERIRALEMGAAEAQVLRVRRVGREPFGIDVEHEEDRAIRHVGRQEIVRFPGIDRDDGVLGEPPALIANVDLRRRSADMEDQVPFAVCVHVEGTVQLIDRRAAEPAVEDGKRPAHALPPAGCLLLFRPAFNIRGENARVRRSPSATAPRQPAAALALQKIGQYFLHSGTVRLGRPILANTAGS